MGTPPNTEYLHSSSIEYPQGLSKTLCHKDFSVIPSYGPKCLIHKHGKQKKC